MLGICLALVQIFSGAMISVSATPSDPVKIGETGYATLQDAISAAKAGDVIQVMQDLDTTKTYVIPQGVLLDLSGHSVKGSAWAFLQNSMAVDSQPAIGKLYGAVLYQTQGFTLGANAFTQNQMVGKGYVPVKKGDYYAFYNVNYFMERFGNKNGENLNAFSIRPYVLDHEGNYALSADLFSSGSGVEIRVQTTGKISDETKKLTCVPASTYLSELGASLTASLQIVYQGLGAYDEVSVTPIITTDLLSIYGGAVKYEK